MTNVLFGVDGSNSSEAALWEEQFKYLQDYSGYYGGYSYGYQAAKGTQRCSETNKKAGDARNDFSHVAAVAN